MDTVIQHPDPRHRPARWLLPPDAYTSQVWFEREQETLFERCWAFAGMSDDLPDPGDFLTVDVGRQPLVVVRSPDGGLRAFHNVCRHRGAQLLEATGNVARGISCFYHRWRYELDGALTTVPQPDQFPGLCREDWGLKPASVATWNGLMFVHTDELPDQDLTSWLGRVPELMGPYEPLQLVEVPPIRHEVQANWKFFVENHVDGYHLWHLHARSIRGLAHHRQDWEATGRHWSFYEPSTEEGGHADQALTGLPLIPTVPVGGYGSSVQLVFPNLAMAGGSTFWTTIHVQPRAPDRTTVVLRTRIAPILSARHAGLLLRLCARSWRQALGRTPLGPALRSVHILPEGDDDSPAFVAEDILAAESLQRTIASPRFEVGPLATDYENAISFFQQNILDHTHPTS